MVKGIGGFGFLDKRHCEKTSFVVAGGIGAIIFMVLTGFDYIIQFQNYSQSLFILVIIVTVAGYLGVLWYKIMNHKKLTITNLIIFWNNK